MTFSKTYKQEDKDKRTQIPYNKSPTQSQHNPDRSTPNLYWIVIVTKVQAISTKCHRFIMVAPRIQTRKNRYMIKN